MSKLTIVIKDGVLDKVFTEIDDVEVELINFDNVSSLQEKNDYEKRVRELESESH